MTTRTYAVDRREGKHAVLVDDDGATVEIAARTLPRGAAREGTVLRVPLDADGAPRWRDAVVDEEEAGRRRDEAAARLAELQRGDDGGDVTL